MIIILYYILLESPSPPVRCITAELPKPLEGAGDEPKELSTPNLPTNIVPVLTLLDSSFPENPLRIPLLIIKITLESNPLKSTMLVGRMGVANEWTLTLTETP